MIPGQKILGKLSFLFRS